MVARSAHSTPVSSLKCVAALAPCGWWRRDESSWVFVCARACERVMPKTQLVELDAHGLGVIDDARLEFGEGFNVITGETGAGKTLLLGALELCIGSDGPSTRHALSGETRASAVFIDKEGREVVLAREAGSTGPVSYT